MIRRHARGDDMSRIRFIAICASLLFAFAAIGQLATTSPGTHGSVPAVEDHLKLLTAKLDLTADQQQKVRRVLQELHDGTQQLMDDQTQSPDERLAHARPLRYKADKQIRELLNIDQKKKLDQLEQQSGAELHGNLK
jgi:Spy/CpxP family protein refolding chaperone